MQEYTFDEICESQDFDHNKKFVLKLYAEKEIKSLKNREKKLVAIINSAKIFIENGHNHECFDLYDQNKNCRHDDWSDSVREVLSELGVEL